MLTWRMGEVGLGVRGGKFEGFKLFFHPEILLIFNIFLILHRSSNIMSLLPLLILLLLPPNPILPQS